MGYYGGSVGSYGYGGGGSGYGYGGYYGYGGIGYPGDGGFYDGVDYVLDEFMVYGTNDGFGYGADFGYFGSYFTQDNFYTGYTLSSYSDGSGDPDYSDNDSSIPSVFRHPDAMEGGTQWRQNKLPPIQKKRQQVMDGTLMRALIQGDGENFVQKVYESIKDAYETDPNSFAANTFLAPNGKTYELPPASEEAVGTENEYASRIQNFVDSFAYLRQYNRTVAQRPGGMGEDGVFAYFTGEGLSSEDYQEFLNSSKYFPQVLNQGSETISEDGTVITYPDGTSFYVDLGDRTDFRPGTAGGFTDLQELNFEGDPDALSNQYGRFYNDFIDTHVENWRLGNDWTTLSIGYDGSIYGETGYDQDGYNRQGHDSAGYDRDGFHYEGYNEEGLDASGNVWRDEDGYDLQGYDPNGLNAEGFDINNRDADGYDLEGLDVMGYDREGYDGAGRDVEGYDRFNMGLDGYNREGYDLQGYDREGYDSAGFDPMGVDREGYDFRGYNDITGFDREGFNQDGVNIDGLTAQEVDEGWTVDGDGTLVMPVTSVVADGGDGDGDGDGDGFDDGFDDGFGLGDGDGDGNGDFDPEGSGFPGMDPNQDIPLEDLILPDITAEQQARLNEIANRFGGSRRAYNDFLQSEEGQEAAKNLGDFINDNLSPSGEFDMTKRAELFDKIALAATDGGFSGLNAFALGVNLIEGITDTNLIDVPNVGFLIDNLTEKFLSEDLLSDIEKVVPDFLENLTGLDAILKANSDASGYLGQGFDFSAWLLGDLGMAREVDYGLRPATEQLRQQQEDYFREYFGSDVYDRFIATTPEDDPNFLEKIIDFGQTVFGGIGDFAEDIGFAQQKYLGGTLPTNLLNLVGLSSMGLPIGSLADMVGGALAPSGQDLSDYLYEQGIDPTTATRSDIGAFLVDEGYDVPNFNSQTGEFIIPTTADGNEFNLDTDGDGFVDNFASNLSDFAGDDTLVGKLIGGQVTLTDGLLEVVSGTVNEGTDILDGVTQNGTDNNNGNTVVFPDGNDGNENNTGTSVTQDGYDENGNLIVDQNLDGDGNTGDGDGVFGDDGNGGTGVDGNGNITTGNMSDTDENAYDAAYETAKFILGAGEAERFRGVGLGNEELQAIIGDYTSMVGQSEAERLLELNRIEQTGINELRDVQKASDLELLGNYGQAYAEAVRGLDPTAQGVLGDQAELSSRLYRRAAGDLTAEEEADAEERAFEVASTTGRTMDSTRIANVLRAEEDMIANLEGRAQQAGTSTYNMSRGLTGNIPAMLLGNQGNPYGAGIGQVTPPLGIGDVISMGTQNYAQNQNIAEAQRQLDIVNQQYDAAIAANEPSKAQEFLAQADEIMGYISLVGQGVQALGNLPGTVRNVRNTVSNAFSGVRTLFSGGSSTPSYNSGSRFNFTPQEFNVNDYLDLGTFGQGSSSGGGSSFKYDFGDFG